MNEVVFDTPFLLHDCPLLIWYFPLQKEHLTRVKWKQSIHLHVGIWASKCPQGHQNGNMYRAEPQHQTSHFYYTSAAKTLWLKVSVKSIHTSASLQKTFRLSLFSDTFQLPTVEHRPDIVVGKPHTLHGIQLSSNIMAIFSSVHWWEKLRPRAIK